MLLAPVQTIDLSAAQMLPEFLFGGCEVFAEFARPLLNLNRGSPPRMCCSQVSSPLPTSPITWGRRECLAQLYAYPIKTDNRCTHIKLSPVLTGEGREGAAP